MRTVPWRRGIVFPFLLLSIVFLHPFRPSRPLVSVQDFSGFIPCLVAAMVSRLQDTHVQNNVKTIETLWRNLLQAVYQDSFSNMFSVYWFASLFPFTFLGSSPFVSHNLRLICRALNGNKIALSQKKGDSVQYVYNLVDELQTFIYDIMKRSVCSFHCHSSSSVLLPSHVFSADWRIFFKTHFGQRFLAFIDLEAELFKTTKDGKHVLKNSPEQVCEVNIACFFIVCISFSKHQYHLHLLPLHFSLEVSETLFKPSTHHFRSICVTQSQTLSQSVPIYRKVVRVCYS